MSELIATPPGIRERILHVLAPLLEEAGLSFVPGPLLVYGSTDDHGQRYVSIDLAPYVDTFDVFLQTIAPDGTRRHVSRSAFSGSTEFQLGQRDAAVLESSLTRVRAEFLSHGVSWLRGRDVLTPAMQSHRELVTTMQAEQLANTAAIAFKARDYSTAARLFGKSQSLKPLSTVHGGMLEYATRKAPRLGV